MKETLEPQWLGSTHTQDLLQIIWLALQARLATRLSRPEGYDPESRALRLQGCVVEDGCSLRLVVEGMNH